MSKQVHCNGCNCIVDCACGKHSVRVSSGVELQDMDGRTEVHTMDQCWREVIRTEIIKSLVTTSVDGE